MKIILPLNNWKRVGTSFARQPPSMGNPVGVVVADFKQHFVDVSVCNRPKEKVFRAIKGAFPAFQAFDRQA